jgi:hypothetical protein
VAVAPEERITIKERRARSSRPLLVLEEAVAEIIVKDHADLRYQMNEPET